MNNLLIISGCNITALISATKFLANYSLPTYYMINRKFGAVQRGTYVNSQVWIPEIVSESSQVGSPYRIVADNHNSAAFVQHDGDKILAVNVQQPTGADAVVILSPGLVKGTQDFG
jgi:hypothetical protein